ncbi:hypothetical protein NC653_022606 [Populus alba x Populus x berolinensis]|uniref:Uncharacterized protein n=1 Tax=Populus alba x Populus x berolinensis TaxID=444605 RepID=A0AAD6MF46_9ROSI|nr:hypothetical protein NC653_022606 [Populus alba x Populus x berolinensis]
MQGLQPQDWWDLHHEIDYPLFGSHVSTAVLIPPTPRQLSDATTVDTGGLAFVLLPGYGAQRENHMAMGPGIIIVSEDVEKEAPPLIIRNKLLRKEGPSVNGRAIAWMTLLS